MSCVFIGKEYQLVCGFSNNVEGVRSSVLFVGCLVAATHGWFVVALMFHVLCRLWRCRASADFSV